MRSLVLKENSHLIDKPDFRIPRPGIWPSETSVKYELAGREHVDGKCMRAAWYRIMGYKPQTRDPNMEMKGSLGKSAEEACVERWKKMGLLIDNNVKFFIKKYGLSGEMDAVLRPGDPEMDPVGYEIKSFYGGGASRELCGSKRPPVPGAPKADHLLQAAVYFDVYKEKMSEYRLYYVERGDGHRIEFKVLLEPEGDTHRVGYQQVPGPYWSTESNEEVLKPYTIKDIHERMDKLVECVKARNKPSREFKKTWDAEDVEWAHSAGLISDYKLKGFKKGKPLGAWQCGYCAFANQCYGEKE